MVTPIQPLSILPSRKHRLLGGAVWSGFERPLPQFSVTKTMQALVPLGNCHNDAGRTDVRDALGGYSAMAR